MLHGDSTPRVTLTQVKQGELVYWYAMTQNVAEAPLTLVSVEPVTVSKGLVFDGAIFIASDDYPVPLLGWAGPSADDPIATRPSRSVSGVVVRPGDGLDGVVYLTFHVTDPLTELTAEGVRWTYEMEGQRYPEQTKAVVRVTHDSRPPL